MSRYLIFASHRTLSEGMANALRFFAGDNLKIKVLTAYMDNKPIEDQIKALFNDIKPSDEVVVMTDILAGSVNQKFLPYLRRPNTHIFSGINLPLALGLAMEPDDKLLKPEKIAQLVQEAKNQLVYVNSLNINGDVDEEDE